MDFPILRHLIALFTQTCVIVAHNFHNSWALNHYCIFGIAGPLHCQHFPSPAHPKSHTHIQLQAHQCNHPLPLQCSIKYSLALTCHDPTTSPLFWYWPHYWYGTTALMIDCKYSNKVSFNLYRYMYSPRRSAINAAELAGMNTKLTWLVNVNSEWKIFVKKKKFAMPIEFYGGGGLQSI